MHNKPFKAAIFDLDGTLVNSLPDIAASMNNVLGNNNLPQHNIESYKYFVGNGMRKLVERSLPETSSVELIEKCFAEMMKVYNRNCVDKTVLYDGIPELFDNLSLLGIKMSILSNKPDSITQELCKKLLNKWRFEIILGATEHFPRKPEPDSALFIAKHMNVSTASIGYLGDTNTDMQTAINAGFFPIGVLWGFRTADELLKSGAKVLIEKPKDCLKYFSTPL